MSAFWHLLDQQHKDGATTCIQQVSSSSFCTFSQVGIASLSRWSQTSACSSESCMWLSIFQALAPNSHFCKNGNNQLESLTDTVGDEGKKCVCSLPKKVVVLVSDKVVKAKIALTVFHFEQTGKKWQSKQQCFLCLGKQTSVTWTNISSEILAAWKPISTAHKPHMISCKPHSTQSWFSGSGEKLKDFSLRTGFSRWNWLWRNKLTRKKFGNEISNFSLMMNWKIIFVLLGMPLQADFFMQFQHLHPHACFHVMASSLQCTNGLQRPKGEASVGTHIWLRPTWPKRLWSSVSNCGNWGLVQCWTWRSQNTSYRNLQGGQSLWQMCWGLANIWRSQECSQNNPFC
mgnify:CR=1 FL=1